MMSPRYLRQFSLMILKLEAEAGLNIVPIPIADRQMFTPKLEAAMMK